MIKADIKIPTSWSELTDTQAAQIISVVHLAKGLSKEEALLICALRTSGIKMISADSSGALLLIPKAYTSTRRTIMSRIPYQRLTQLISAISWVLDMPDIPWRPKKLMLARPVDPRLNDLTFGQFLEADALYSAHITAPDYLKLRSLARILVPHALRHPAQWEQHAIIMWFSSIKTWLSHRYPNLYTRSAIDGTGGTLAPSRQSFQAQFDALLRALTKGDPLKEDAVLGLPLHRALTELDALAAETEKIRSLSRK